MWTLHEGRGMSLPGLYHLHALRCIRAGSVVTMLYTTISTRRRWERPFAEDGLKPA